MGHTKHHCRAISKPAYTAKSRSTLLLHHTRHHITCRRTQGATQRHHYYRLYHSAYLRIIDVQK